MDNGVKCVSQKNASKTSSALPLALILFGYPVCVECVSEGTVDVALGLIDVDLFHLGIAKEGWASLLAVRGRFTQI